MQYKVVDPAKGELYQPLVILPSAEVNFTRENFVSMNGAPIKVPVHIKKNGSQGEEWVSKVTPVKLFTSFTASSKEEIADKNRNALLNYRPISKKDNYKEELSLLPERQNYFNGSTRVIAYDHIPTITYFSPAKTNLIHLDIKTAGKNRLCSRAGDKVPAALEQLGYEVKILGEEDLQVDYLAQFDAVIPVSGPVIFMNF